MKTTDIIAEVASLPVEERVMVAETILRTLNPPDPEIDRKWQEVARQRLAAIQSGAVQAVPGDEVLQNLRKRFGL